MKKILKKIFLSPWLALLTFALLVFIKVSNPYLVDMGRLKFYDYLMLGKPIAANEIVLANIDEKAIQKYGQFPFPRTVYADIIKDLKDRHATLLGNTVLFLEPDRMGGDSALQNAMTSYPVILSQTVGNCARNNTNTKRTGVAVIGDGKATEYLPEYPCVLDNIYDIQTLAIGTGITSTLPEADGVVRRVPMLAMSKGEYYPSFSLEILRAFAGQESYQAKINQTGVEAVRIPSFPVIKTDEYSRVFVNWNYRFSEFSIADMPTDLTGKIVLLGVTAAGVTNPVATPVGAQFPHAVQANLLHTLLQGDSVAIPQWTQAADYAALILLTLAIILLSSLRFSIIYIIVLIAGYLYLPRYLFEHNKILFDVSFNVFAILLIYLHIYTVKFISELMQKLQIKKQFGTYLSPALVEKLQKNPELLKLGGETRELSIMFTDVRGFTAISEHYGKDVQGLTQIMNKYMTVMTDKILKNAGTLDKYIGDAQMAFWNAPLDDKEHRRNALKTSLQMLEDLDQFNYDIAAMGVPAFGMGLGINTGDVVVGNMGSSQRFDYTCLGDSVNLASRLEGQSKEYGVRIVLGHNTVQGIDDEFFILELDTIAVKGKKEGVRIYTCLGYNSKLSEYKKARAKHAQFLSDYRAKRFDSCARSIETLRSSFTGNMADYYAMMLKRCEYFIKNPPGKDWDGVYRAQSK
jgi:adenylate cyclase